MIRSNEASLLDAGAAPSSITVLAAQRLMPYLIGMEFDVVRGVTRSTSCKEITQSRKNAVIFNMGDLKITHVNRQLKVLL